MDDKKKGEMQASGKDRLANRPILHREPQGSSQTMHQKGANGKPNKETGSDGMIGFLSRSLRGEPVKFSAPRAKEYEPGGPYEALGMAAKRLKGVTDRAQAAGIFAGLLDEFRDDPAGLALLREVESRAEEPGRVDSHEVQPMAAGAAALPVEFGGEEPPETYPTLEQIAKIIGETVYVWKGYIMAAGLNSIGADPGAGKTTFMMDLHRRQWHGLAWPDGEPIEKTGRRVVWLMADQRLSQLVDSARAMGVPLDSIVIAAEKGSPTFPLTLENRQTDSHEVQPLERLLTIVDKVKPWALVIDSVTSAMGTNKGKNEDLNPIKSYLLDIAIAHKIPVILLCHLNSNGNILGRVWERHCEHQLGLVLTDKSNNRSPRNLHVKRSRRLEDTQSFGINHSQAGWDYCEPHQEVDDTSQLILTKRGSVKDLVSRAALDMAAMAAEKGFIQIELVNSLLSESEGKETPANMRNRVSRAVKVLVERNELREENGRLYLPPAF